MSYYLSKALKKPIVWGKPMAISIEPTTSCNLRCPQCPSGLRSFTRSTGMLNQDTNQKIIDQMRKYISYITYYFQGEPYLNKELHGMINKAHKAGIYTTTSTNGHYLNDIDCLNIINSGLNKLIISIDGATQESYSKYRIGGNFEKVLEGTKRLTALKKERKSKYPYIVWQTVIFSHNEKEIPQLNQLAKECSVDEIQLKTAQIYDFEKNIDLIPKNKKYSRYILKNGKYQIKNKLLNQCWRMWHSCVFTWDGNVVPCCFDKDAKYQFGNINKIPFKNIWKNQNYQSFRNLLLRSRKNISICTNCSEGTKIFSEL